MRGLRIASLGGLVVAVALLATSSPTAADTDQDNTIQRPPHGAVPAAAHLASVQLLRRWEGLPGFAGMEVTDGGGRIRVKFAVAASRAHAEAIAQLEAPGVAIDYLPATRSYDQLEAMKSLVVGAKSRFNAARIELSHWGPSFSHNKLQVAIVDFDTDKAKQAHDLLDNRDDVVIIPGKRYEKRSRLDDSAPWNAGIAISMDNGFNCTAGPAVRSTSGVIFLMTAGHCFVGDEYPWFNSYDFNVYNDSWNVPAPGGFIGKAAAENDSLAGYDLALIKSGSSGLQFRSSLTASATGVPQKGQLGNVTGNRVCVSGAYSGERCNAVIRQVNQSVNVGGTDLIHMVIASHDNPSTSIGGNWDSGASVYEVHASGIFVNGMMNGGSIGMACPTYNIGDRAGTCSNDVVYVDLGSALSHRGIALYTR